LSWLGTEARCHSVTEDGTSLRAYDGQVRGIGTPARECLIIEQDGPVLREAGQPGYDSAPGSVCSRGRAVAGALVASRRKARHGSSRTVFHEGSGLSPGDTSAPT